MEKSYIKKIDSKYLFKIGFTPMEIDMVETLVNEGIKNQLYTKSRIPYHNLSHAEKVIMYSIWIANEIEKTGEILNEKSILFKAALYHDCGRSWKLFGENHGVTGAKKTRKLLKNAVEPKSLNIIELLIETHAKKEDTVDFKDYNFTKKEKENIQKLSNILKDADALDRNRIRLFPFARCNANYLRTIEAKKIYLKSDEFYNKYLEATKK